MNKIRLVEFDNKQKMLRGFCGARVMMPVEMFKYISVIISENCL